jgi:hypothetical protein
MVCAEMDGWWAVMGSHYAFLYLQYEVRKEREKMALEIEALKKDDAEKAAKILMLESDIEKIKVDIKPK